MIKTFEVYVQITESEFSLMVVCGNLVNRMHDSIHVVAAELQITYGPVEYPKFKLIDNLNSRVAK